MCAPSGRSAGGSVIIVRASARDCSSRAVVAEIGVLKVVVVGPLAPGVVHFGAAVVVVVHVIFYVPAAAVVFAALF